jgi:hypothetical protein
MLLVYLVVLGVLGWLLKRWYIGEFFSVLKSGGITVFVRKRFEEEKRCKQFRSFSFFLLLFVFLFLASVFSFKLLGKEMVFLSDPDLIELILKDSQQQLEVFSTAMLPLLKNLFLLTPDTVQKGRIN